MGDEFEVDPASLRAAAAQLDEHATQVAGHGETLGASTAAPVGHGPIGEAVDAVVKRSIRLAAHDITAAVHKFYTDAATVMRKTAAETERRDAEAGQAFDELGRGPGIDDLAASQGRGMGHAFRRSPHRRLSPEEVDQLKADFESIGGDPAILRFNKGPQTSYRDEVDLIYVRGDVLPSADPTATNANATLSPRAALAHELGHRQFRGTALEPGDVRDEIRASVWAARSVTQLADGERMDLLLDAQQRAQSAGEWAVMDQLGAMLRQPVIKWQGWSLDLPWWDE